MSNEKSIEDYSTVIIENGIKKIGENIADRALNFVVDALKREFRHSRIRIGTAFERYLDNAYNRINQVKTLATGNDPRSIIGENNLYVKIGVKYKKKEIDTSSVDNITAFNNNILILGTGGVGKSMLSRYLFLQTVLDGDYIPVYVELRTISQQSAGSVSIIKLIKDCMGQFDIELPENEFIFSLRLGKYLFLFDGFDEVKEDISLETAVKIQRFCAKYPNNKCIVTSRQMANCEPLETFIHMHSMPLRKDQAIELASKIWDKDEKTEEFCKQLNENLFDKHKSFAENPLLLSMMFLTFMRNLSIPDHLVDFYKKAYEALYSQHDNHNKGVFRRDFKCQNLDEAQFRTLFARFCFQTYYQEKYEFREAEILGFIKKSSDYLGYSIDNKDYLEDLKTSVCMIVEDGIAYKFSHRSFQAYFAALYTSEKLTDEKQKLLFSDILSNKQFYNYEDYFELLNQIEHERFTVNAIEYGLRELYKKAIAYDNPDKFILKRHVKSVYYVIDKEDSSLSSFNIDSSNNKYNNAIITIFQKHILNTDYYGYISPSFLINRLSEVVLSPSFDYNKREDEDTISGGIDLVGFEDCKSVSKENKEKLYNILLCFFYRGIHTLSESIREWLDKLDIERDSLTDKHYIDNL